MKLFQYIKIFVLMIINNYLLGASLSGSVIIDNTDKSFSFSDKALIIEDTGGTFGSVKITSPGSFIFPNTVNDHKNHSYSLKLTQIPDNQFICTTNQSSGAVFLNDKTDLIISCKGKYYISINVSGLSNDDNYSIVDNNQTLSFNAANTNITQTFAQWYYYNFNYYLKAYFNYTSSNYKRCSNNRIGTITDNVTINISCNTSYFNNIYYQPSDRYGVVSWKDNLGNVYVFGGNNNEFYYNDLWKFNGISWTQVIANGVYGSPSNRSGAVSWVDRLGDIYVFGGKGSGSYNSSYYNDLWKFDGKNWTQLIDNGVNASPNHRWFATSWTDNLGNAYIFGGGDNLNTYNDLWRFDGTSWSQINTIGSSPSARIAATSWTDKNGEGYVFGGSYYGSGYNDLWRFDGKNWTILIQDGVNGSPSRRWLVTSWTDNLGNAYIFGGFENQILYNDLWRFNGTSWSQINTIGSSPSARIAATSWTDNYGNVYVFGGCNDGFIFSNDLWKLNQNNWTQVITNGVNTTPPTARNLAVSWTDKLGNTYVFGGNGNSIYNDLWQFNGTSWSQITIGGTIPSARFGAVAWTDIHGNAYVFGGKNSSTYYNDLWQFNGTSWSQITIGGTIPSARSGAVAWTDIHGNAYVFGGKNSSTYYNDLWQFNGTSWSQITIGGTIPSARSGAVAWTDIHGNAYVFGGFDGTYYYHDLWQFNGTSWSQIIILGVEPYGRSGAVAWKDNIGNYYLYGGYIYNNSQSIYWHDLWKFNGTSWSQITDVGILPNAVYGATSWLDNAGNVYIFGGYNGLTYSNDLFKI